MSMTAANGPQFLPMKFEILLLEEQRQNREHSVFEQYGVDKYVVDVLSQANQLSMRFSTNFYSNSSEEGLEVLRQLSSLLQRFLQLAPNVNGDPDTSALSESCRYAGALHVLFPLMAHYPDPTLMKNALVHKLKDFLAYLIPSYYVASPVLLWCLAVGGVSALQMPERNFFVGHLAVVTADLGISSWDVMRTTLIRVMQYAVFCEDSFRTVWDEAVAKADA
jgi:hypothetical protein